MSVILIHSVNVNIHVSLFPEQAYFLFVFFLTRCSLTVLHELQLELSSILEP